MKDKVLVENGSGLLPLPTDGRLLTAREREVLKLLVERKRDKDIAAALGISVRTAEKHAERVRRKMGVRSRREIRAGAVSALGDSGAGERELRVA